MDDEIYEIGRVVGFVGKNDVAVFCCEELRAVLTTDWIVGFPSTRSLCPIVYWSGYSRADPDSYSIERPSGISIELRQTRFQYITGCVPVGCHCVPAYTGVRVINPRDFDAAHVQQPAAWPEPVITRVYINEQRNAGSDDTNDGHTRIRQCI